VQTFIHSRAQFEDDTLGNIQPVKVMVEDVTNMHGLAERGSATFLQGNCTHFCVQHDAREKARRAGPSAATDTCRADEKQVIL